jgi:formate C-acetyltransferase
MEIFDVYTPQMLKYRKTWILTWLPDNYSRGRIIWDYRRLALYGIDILIEAKEDDKNALEWEMMNDTIQLREEISEQIKALKQIKEWLQCMVLIFLDLQRMHTKLFNGHIFAFLAAIKEQDWAAMSLGNVSSFLDILLKKILENESWMRNKLKN